MICWGRHSRGYVNRLACHQPRNRQYKVCRRSDKRRSVYDDDAGRSAKTKQGFIDGKQEICRKFHLNYASGVRVLCRYCGHKLRQNFINDVTTAASALGRLGQNLDTSPQEIGAWGAAIERAGGNASEASQDCQELSRRLFQLNRLGKDIPLELRMPGGKETNLDINHGIVAYITSLGKAVEAFRKAGGSRSDAFNFLTSAKPSPGGFSERRTMLVEQFHAAAAAAKNTASIDEIARTLWCGHGDGLKEKILRYVDNGLDQTAQGKADFVPWQQRIENLGKRNPQANREDGILYQGMELNGKTYGKEVPFYDVLGDITGSSLNGVGKAVFWVRLGSDRLGSSLL